jgi:hypothetical protein
VYQIDVVRGPLPGPVLDSVVELDRANMGAILCSSGLPFPEAERRARLSDASTELAVVRAGERMVAYVELAPDSRRPQGVYVASLQIAPERRSGLALAHLLGRAALLLRERQPSSIRAQAQRVNSRAFELMGKLGFRVVDAASSATTLEAVASSAILESPVVTRLIRRHQQIAVT